MITTFLFFIICDTYYLVIFIIIIFFLDKMTIWQILWQARVTFNILHNAIISISRIIKWGGKWWRWSYHFLSRNKIFVCRLTSKLKFMFFYILFVLMKFFSEILICYIKEIPGKLNKKKACQINVRPSHFFSVIHRLHFIYIFLYIYRAHSSNIIN